jgi:hypothetical protein
VPLNLRGYTFSESKKLVIKYVGVLLFEEAAEAQSKLPFKRAIIIKSVLYAENLCR